MVIGKWQVCDALNRSAMGSLHQLPITNYQLPHEERAMRVLKLNDLPEIPMGKATPIDGWTGGPVVRMRQEVITEGQSDFFRCSVVNFRPGATTGWHVHDCDQLLIVTAGRGVVANETEEREITVGDVVQVQAGERQWPGARRDAPLLHLTVTAPVKGKA